MRLFIFQDEEAQCTVDVTESVGKWGTSCFLFKGQNFLVTVQVDGFGLFFILSLFL